MERAATGDRLVVDGGVHQGPLLVDRTLELVGRNRPVIEGAGRGTVVTITAPRALLTGFVVRGSGSSLDEENSGISLDGSADSRIADNRLEDVLFGIYLRDSSGAEISGNEIVGKGLELPRRGDAIRVWYSDDVVVEDNRVTGARDVVLWYSERLTVRRNRVIGGRYGLHFMYCDDAQIEENLLLDNSVGAFLMYSRRLRLERNTIAGNHGPSGFGVGLKDMDDAEVRANRFIGNRVGAFLDNSPRESASRVELVGNSFAGNDIGVTILPNVARGHFLDNSFVENEQQVEVAGRGGDPSRNLWHGNYWSTYVGYDADGDGRGDVAFEAKRLFEDLADRQPALRLFSFSPAKEALELAARTLPLIQPRAKLVDELPRMRPSEPSGCPRVEARSGVGFLGLGVTLVALATLLCAAPAAARRVDGGAGTGERLERAAPLIAARAVSKRFGATTALEAVDFEIESGEAVAVWGPNGAGKTTLLRVLLGIVPYEGEVVVAGADTWREGKAARRVIGFVPQEVALQADVAVGETLELFARLRQVASDGLEDLLERVGLERQVDKRVGELSGGQRQRLALALALLSQPSILVLDEPTANLDARARADFISLLGELKAAGQTLVFSSHRPEEVLAVADRVLHLDAGRLIGDSAPSRALFSRGRIAELWLRLGPEALDAGAEALRLAGLEPRQLGEHLVVEVDAERKLEPIRALDRAGVGLIDFEVDSVEGRESRRGG
jgi:nitrous oxidase accessory protein